MQNPSSAAKRIRYYCQQEPCLGRSGWTRMSKNRCLWSCLRENSFPLVGYCDADFAGDACDRKKTSGFASLQGSVLLGSNTFYASLLRIRHRRMTQLRNGWLDLPFHSGDDWSFRFIPVSNSTVGAGTRTTNGFFSFLFTTFLVPITSSLLTRTSLFFDKKRSLIYFNSIFQYI